MIIGTVVIVAFVLVGLFAVPLSNWLVQPETLWKRPGAA